MGDVEIIIKKELFDSIGVIVSEPNCCIHKENDIWIEGNVSINENKLGGRTFSVSANLCDEDNGILFDFREYPLISFKEKSTDFFILHCVDITRFFDIDLLHHIEIYPRVASK